MRLHMLPPLCAIILALQLVAGAALHKRNGTRFDRAAFKLAAVRAPPPLWSLPMNNYTFNGLDLDAAVDYAIELIHRAEAEGAGLIAFPELWLPGYPKYDNGSLYMPFLIENSLVVGSSQWNKIIAATKQAAIYVGLSFSELDGDAIYIGQSLLGPDGTTLIRRRKLRPSGGERNIWSDGDITGLQVVDTPYGRMGMLSCWEHFHSAMTFSMYAQLEDIHIGAWPYLPAYGQQKDYQFWQTAEVNMAAAGAYSIESGATLVIPSVGNAHIFNQLGQVVESPQNPEGDLHSAPFVFHTVNTTAFSGRKFNIDGQYGWGVLKEIEAGYPSDISRDNGTFVAKQTITTATLLALAANGTAPHT